MFLKKRNGKELAIIQVLILVGVFSVFFLGSCGDEANEEKANEEKANEEKANEGKANEGKANEGKANEEKANEVVEELSKEEKEAMKKEAEKKEEKEEIKTDDKTYDKIYVWNHGDTKGKIGANRAAIDKVCSGSDGMPGLVKKVAVKYETKSLVLAHDIDNFKKLIPVGDDAHNFKVYALPLDSSKETLLSDNYGDFRTKPWKKTLNEAGFHGGGMMADFWVGSDPSETSKKHATNYHCKNFNFGKSFDPDNAHLGFADETVSATSRSFSIKGIMNNESPLMSSRRFGCGMSKALLCLSYPKKD